MGSSNKVNCKTFNDTATVITNRPDLGLVTPKNPVGHPNEAAHAAAVNLAQDPPTRAMGVQAVLNANALSQTSNWTPGQ